MRMVRLQAFPNQQYVIHHQNGTCRGDATGSIDDIIYIDCRSFFGPLEICYCMNVPHNGLVFDLCRLITNSIVKEARVFRSVGFDASLILFF